MNDLILELKEQNQEFIIHIDSKMFSFEYKYDDTIFSLGEPVDNAAI